MKMLVRMFAICALATLPINNVCATNSSMGNISAQLYYTSGTNVLFFFTHNGIRVGSTNGCTNLQGYRYVINTAGGGKAMVAAIMTAKILNKKISVFGAGECAVWGDTETVLGFSVED